MGEDRDCRKREDEATFGERSDHHFTAGTEAAERAADLVAAPEREQVAAGAEVAAEEARDAVADEAGAEGRGHGVGIHVGAGDDERAVADGKGAREGIKRLRRIALIDRGNEETLAVGTLLVVGHARRGVEQGAFPRPRVEKFSAQADDTTIDVIVR